MTDLIKPRSKHYLVTCRPWFKRSGSTGMASPRNGILLATPFALEFRPSNPSAFHRQASLQTWRPTVGGYRPTFRWRSTCQTSMAHPRLTNPIIRWPWPMYRISVEDPKAIVEQHGADRKAADKAARRIAA